MKFSIVLVIALLSISQSESFGRFKREESLDELPVEGDDEAAVPHEDPEEVDWSEFEDDDDFGPPPPEFDELPEHLGPEFLPSYELEDMISHMWHHQRILMDKLDKKIEGLHKELMTKLDEKLCKEEIKSDS